jgi:Cu-Zn family superoxide dismutase
MVNNLKVANLIDGAAKIIFICAGFSSLIAFSEAKALDSLKVTINTVTAQGIGGSIGSIVFTDTAHGLKITPNLTGLTPGDHGFHIHENPDCEPKEKDGVMVAAQAAGPHYDPTHSGKHAGPHGGGHAGDLPKLEVAADGTATKESVLHGVKLSDITNRSVMIHAGGDNYSDTPAPLGGGGARIACGVIK